MAVGSLVARAEDGACGAILIAGFGATPPSDGDEVCPKEKTGLAGEVAAAPVIEADGVAEVATAAANEGAAGADI